MLKTVIAIFIVIIISVIAAVMGCFKASSMEKDEDFLKWEEEIRRQRHE